MYQIHKLLTSVLLLLITSSFAYSSEENLKVTQNASAQDNHTFQYHNQYSSLVTFNGNIYIFSLNQERQPYINKINESDSNMIQTELLDKGSPVYKVFDDSHHRFSIGVDEQGYIHVIGDMHHGAGGSGKGGSGRANTSNPLPLRLHGGYGEQLYWISDNPEDISSFTFIGDDVTKHFPCYNTTYNYFRQDNNGKLYMAGRQSVRVSRNHESGTMGLCLAKYDSNLKEWTMLGGIPEEGYGFTKTLTDELKSVVWEPHGHNVNEDSQWYQAYYSNIKFDGNNTLHLTTTLNADTIHNDSTHIIYAYSKDEGETFYRVDGSKIESLPMRVTGSEANRASIVLSQNKDNVIFEKMFMGLFWDKNKNPAVTFLNKSDPDKIRTSYRYYDSNTSQWITQEFGIKVSSIRSDHYTTNDGSIFEMGARYQINKLQSFTKEGTDYSLEKADKKTFFSQGLLSEVDKTLLLKENKLRGITEINHKGAVVTITVP